MIRRIARFVVLSPTVVFGCNAILGNDDHHLSQSMPDDGGESARDASGGAGGTPSSGGTRSQSGGAAGSGGAGAHKFPDAGGDSDAATADAGGAGKGGTTGNGGADGPDAAGHDGGTDVPIGKPCAVGSNLCLGNGVITCKNGFWSPKVACESSLVCSGGECTPQPSCQGVKPVCGATKDVDCCSSSVIPAGAFWRSYDAVQFKPPPSYAATVSEFRLDKYEVTVGRFRRFVEAYSRALVSPGAGRNEHNPEDTGWDPAWTRLLPADASALRAAINCGVRSYQQTWTEEPGTNEELPINCLDWHTAYAFCIWDGGRLPTEAEWNYAAAGGGEQRAYPWSDPPAFIKIDGSYANYHDSSNPPLMPIQVGAKSPKGDGKWGQADLAGNLWEWTLDLYSDPYWPSFCEDCANLTYGTDRVFRGGDFLYDEYALLVSVRAPDSPTYPDEHGVRCARSP